MHPCGITHRYRNQVYVNAGLEPGLCQCRTRIRSILVPDWSQVCINAELKVQILESGLSVQDWSQAYVGAGLESGPSWCRTGVRSASILNWSKVCPTAELKLDLSHIYWDEVSKMYPRTDLKSGLSQCWLKSARYVSVPGWSQIGVSQVGLKPAVCPRSGLEKACIIVDWSQVYLSAGLESGLC